MKLSAALLLCLLPLQAFAQDVPALKPGELDTGLLGTPRIIKPQGVPKGVAFLFSGEAGWGASEQGVADRLTAGGLVTVGVNLPDYRVLLDKDDGECLYLISDIEGVSYQLQRELGVQAFRSPLIGGLGAGGGLVLSMVQQTPANTIGEAIAVDALPPPALNKPLCGLDDVPPDVGVKSIKASFTPAADPAGRANVKAVAAKGVVIETADSTADAVTTLSDAVIAHFKAPPETGDRLSTLPLVELPAKTPSDTMAIVYSGDGGWRDIDKSIAEVFQTKGVSTLGIDALRYFWSERKPAEVADDLALIITRYTARWHAKRVLLVGFSFGADVIPAAYNALPPEAKRMVKQISLLSAAGQVSYEISVAGWLGQDDDNGPSSIVDLKRINPALVQCIYGKEDDEAICPKLADTGIDLIATEGGHHFDEDYEALAARILDGAKRR